MQNKNNNQENEKSSAQQSEANEKIRILFFSKQDKRKQRTTKEKDLGVWGTKYCTQISPCTVQGKLCAIEGLLILEGK